MNPAYVAEFARYPHQPWSEITAELHAELAAVQAAAARSGDRVTPADYAEALVPLAMRLAATVHDEGPDAVRGVLHAIRLEPRPDGVDPWQALAVVLAGMVDPDRTASELLAWTEAIPDGDARNEVLVPPPGDIDPIAVERGVDGDIDPERLRPMERAEVVRVLTRRGLSITEIAERTAMTTSTVHRWRHANGDRTRHLTVHTGRESA